jgi:hypothetical protein
MTTLRARHSRRHDRGYLDWLKERDCACGCGKGPPCDPAHLRAGSLQYKKIGITGLQEKPDDRWALPLKHACHMAQHAYGNELEWWASRGVRDPFKLCLVLYECYGGDGGHPAPAKKRKPRPPKDKRRKIPSRPFNRKRKA